MSHTINLTFNMANKKHTPANVTQAAKQILAMVEDNNSVTDFDLSISLQEAPRNCTFGNEVVTLLNEKTLTNKLALCGENSFNTRTKPLEPGKVSLHVFSAKTASIIKSRDIKSREIKSRNPNKGACLLDIKIDGKTRTFRA